VSVRTGPFATPGHRAVVPPAASRRRSGREPARTARGHPRHGGRSAIGRGNIPRQVRLRVPQPAPLAGEPSRAAMTASVSSSMRPGARVVTPAIGR
jgi:hypothetical protein